MIERHLKEAVQHFEQGLAIGTGEAETLNDAIDGGLPGSPDWYGTLRLLHH